MTPYRPRKKFRPANLRRFSTRQLIEIRDRLSIRCDLPFAFDMTGMPGDTVGGDECYARLGEVMDAIKQRTELRRVAA